MPHVQYWARVRAGMDCPLRRGAWYRVVELTPGETVLEVNSRLLRVPRAFLQILPLRPPMWSLVRRRPDDAAPAAEDGKYAVCPSCCERSPVVDSASTLRCRRCGAVTASALRRAVPPPAPAAAPRDGVARPLPPAPGTGGAPPDTARAAPGRDTLASRYPRCD